MADDRNDDEVSFFSSSHSGGGNCVEIAFTRDGDVLLRNSRLPGHQAAFTADEWKAFLAGARDGEFDPAE